MITRIFIAVTDRVNDYNLFYSYYETHMNDDILLPLYLEEEIKGGEALYITIYYDLRSNKIRIGYHDTKPEEGTYYYYPSVKDFIAADPIASFIFDVMI